MQSRVKKGLNIYLVCLFLILAVAGCHKPIGDEEEILSLIEKLRVASTQKDLPVIMDAIAEDYSDPAGRSREDVRGLLSYIFYRVRGIGVTVRRADISVVGESARAEVHVLFTSGRKMQQLDYHTLPQDAVLYVFSADLNKRSGEWKVKEATWTRWGRGANQIS
jgi:hypothetical protein